MQGGKEEVAQVRETLLRRAVEELIDVIGGGLVIGGLVIGGLVIGGLVIGATARGSVVMNKPHNNSTFNKLMSLFSLLEF